MSNFTSNLRQLVQNFIGRPRNIYVSIGVVFLLWMTFFDGNGFYQQYTLQKRLQQLDEEKKYYQNEIVRLEKEKKEYAENPEVMEKIAREQYFLQKRGEDVYVIKPKK